VLAHGQNYNALLVTNTGCTPLTDVRASAMAGKTLMVKVAR